MAMRGGLISHKGNGNGHSYRGRSYPYGLMLVLAFGAALVGVMALHKIRERRIFNLLAEEKNRHISFKLLLQKEKEYTKEMKRKAEETKAKIFSLRNQKMELDRRLFEMQSTIYSLKDERNTMESQLEEKQNQIKRLRDDENPVIALRATLKQKEAEIDDLKHRLKSSSVRVWSVSNIDPSKPLLNTTIMHNMEQKKDKTQFNVESNFSRKENKGEGVEDGSEEKSNIILTTDMSGGQDAINEEATPTAEMKKESSENTTYTMKDVDEQENTIRISRMGGGFGHLSRTKGKRWRALARNRFLKKNVNSRTDGGEIMNSGRFPKEYEDVLRSREAESRKGKDHTKANLFKHHNSEDLKQRKMSETNHQVEGENVMPRDHDNSLTRVVTENTGVDGEASNDPQKAKQPKDEAVASSMDVKELEKKAELNSAERDETEDEMEVADKQEPETEAASGDLTSDFMSDSEDKEGYKEETEESEF